MITGRVIGCDARTPKGYFYKVILRETKTLYITETGSKYSKHSGYPVPKQSWPMHRLDLSSITYLEDN